MSLSVYVAAPYGEATFVRDIIHTRLVEIGATPMSQWAEKATGPEDFSKMTVDALRAAARENDRDLRAAAVCFVYDPTRKGGETYLEFARAIEWGKACVYAAKPLLSMWRTGVVRVGSLDDAFAVLARMVADYREGARGHLLASLASAAQVTP